MERRQRREKDKVKSGNLKAVTKEDSNDGSVAFPESLFWNNTRIL